MSLDLALGIARSGLLAAQRQLAQASQNVANAETPGHTRKELPALALGGGEGPLGVRLGAARREVDAALLAERDARAAEAAAAGLRERLLGRIEAVHGAPGEGGSLPDALGRLRAAFVGLRASPADPALQRAAGDAAERVARRFNEVGGAVAEARQEAHDGIAEELRRANAALREVAELTGRIRGEIAQGRSAAELEDQRDLALARLSESLPARALRAADGGLVLLARNGLALPLDPDRDAFSVAPSAIGPDAYRGPPAGTLPPVLLGGADVTGQLRGGRLAELVALRDSTLPRMQAELDMAAAQLAWRSEAQGLRLFVGAGGAVPDPGAGYATGGVLGFANTVRVSPAVAAEPRLLRDGTHAVAGPPASPFAPNPPGGPSGFVALLDRVLDHGFGETAAPGLGWPAIPTGGLGPDGQLSSPFLAPRSVEGYAATVLAAHAGERAGATELRERAEGLRRGLDARLERESGVDPDAEMAALLRLQNAYAANARVVSTAQQMFDQLMAMGR